jgi:hypothetical protein
MSRKIGKHKISLSLNNGTPFPSLEEVAKQFVSKNGFSGLHIAEYQLPTGNSVNEQIGDGGVSYHGLILTFNKGITNLTIRRQDLNTRLYGREEICFGGSSGWEWRTTYLLGGVINNKPVSLIADYIYSQGRKKRLCRNPNTREKYFDHKLIGEKQLSVYRWDNSQLWFLKEGKASKKE